MIGTPRRNQAMLVISRKPGQRILIGDDIVITVTRVGDLQVRLGIEAPKDVKVYREELLPKDGKAVTP